MYGVRSTKYDTYDTEYQGMDYFVVFSELSAGREFTEGTDTDLGPHVKAETPIGSTTAAPQDELTDRMGLRMSVRASLELQNKSTEHGTS